MTTPTFGSPAGAPLAPSASGKSSYAASLIGQDRLIRKEVSLGVVREIVPPEQHIGLQIAPFMNVPYDDVIFDYAKGLADGMAPARAEDAESDLAQKDDSVLGQGRASVIDWAIKDHYTASDVDRYREYLAMAEQVRDTGAFPLTMNQSTAAEFPGKMARDTARRRRKIDNRLEWLNMTALSTGKIAYNDGKIQFAVDYQRPALQQAQAPKSGVYGGRTHDPIGDIFAIQEYMNDTYGIRIKRAICGQKVLNSFINSDRFTARTGLLASAGSSPVDPAYLMDGWGPQAAVDVVSRATNVQFTVYDSQYRTRQFGSNTTVNNRFFPANRVLFLPDEADITEFDDTGIGFGKTLTSPHPMGNWAPGYYEWERETIDPWGRDAGTGLKAFPVYPHMDLSYTMDVDLTPVP